MGSGRMSTQPRRRISGFLGIALGLLLVGCFLFIGLPYLAVNVWPGIGAQAVDLARGILGDPLVSQIENVVLQSQDAFKQWEYRDLGARPAAPALVEAPAFPTARPTKAAPPSTAVPPTSSLATSTPPPTPISTPSLSPTPTSWAPPQVAVSDPDVSEGTWAPYLWDLTGQAVADLTSFHPDPERLYAYVVVVAFDLQHTQLHFVLGFDEPASTILVLRSGRIPSQDLKVGHLLAAFNGGFKAQHGHFGVMADGTTLIPPIPGMGTVGIDDSGRVQIGIWGKDIVSSPHWVAWRQNGPLIVQDGQVNPLTAHPDPKVWGYIVYGDTATYRSALGLSPDGEILYYAAGPSLTLPVLAHAMQAVGAAQAMQLDINAYWVHFEAFRADGDTLTAVPLLDTMKGIGEHRFLTGSSRDYFYVTTK
jgi:hypothetical protein